MDPNEALRRLLDLAESTQRDAVGGFDYGINLTGRAIDMAELVEALDSWIVAGGFLPERWEGEGER